MKTEDFLTEKVKSEIEKSSIRGITEGWIYYKDSVPTFSVTKLNEPVADVVFRAYGSLGPNKEEMAKQIANKRPMVLVLYIAGVGIEYYAWGDYLLDAPLLDRPFIYGIYDCYEAIRSWKWQNENEYLAPIARENYWWYIGATPNGVVDRSSFVNNPNYYLKLYKELGYSIIRPDDPQIGDGIFFQSKGSTTVNHLAIYVGDGKIYHHLEGRKSEIIELDILKKAMTLRMWVRRTDKVYPEKN